MTDAATKLLDDFRALPGRVERPRTFMEIAGYPHYENVCSNILAFFTDPQESHGLGNLVLDALVSAAGIDISEGSISSSVSVDREVVTNKSNKIDLLITSDSHAILIENKIHAAAKNPFDDYAAYLDRIAHGRNKRKILLTLYPTNAGSGWGFTNLTHEEIVGQIRSLLGHYVSGADARHLTMFLDFLNTLENLQRGSRMNQEFVKVLADRGDDIRSLFNDLKSLRKEMREKVEELQSLINASHPCVEGGGLWRQSDTIAMFDNLSCHIRVAKDLVVSIYARISPHGWEIQIFPRDKGDPLKLTELLQSLKIPFEGKDRFVHATRFTYDADLEQIKPVLQDLIDKLTTSQKREGNLDSA